MSKHQPAKSARGSADNAELFRILGRKRSQEEAFRLYDEHVNEKILAGLKKVTHMMIKQVETMVDKRVQAALKEEVAQQLKQQQQQMRNFELLSTVGTARERGPPDSPATLGTSPLKVPRSEQRSGLKTVRAAAGGSPWGASAVSRKKGEDKHEIKAKDTKGGGSKQLKADRCPPRKEMAQGSELLKTLPRGKKDAVPPAATRSPNLQGFLKTLNASPRGFHQNSSINERKLSQADSMDDAEFWYRSVPGLPPHHFQDMSVRKPSEASLSPIQPKRLGLRDGLSADLSDHAHIHQMLSGSLVESPGQQQAVQDMMRNVDLVLLRNGQCDYDLDVAASEEGDGRSTLYLCIQRRGTADRSSSATARPPYQIGLNPDRCAGIKLHAPGSDSVPEVLGLHPRRDPRDFGNTFEQYSQFTEFQSRESRPEDISVRLQQKLMDQNTRRTKERLPLDRFQSIVGSIGWNFFTMDEMREKFEDKGEGVHVQKGSDWLRYLDHYLPEQAGYGVFYKQNVLSVGVPWCSGAEVVAPSVLQDVLSDTFLKRAVRERPELGQRLSDFMILEERSADNEQAAPELNQGSNGSSNADEGRSAEFATLS